MWGLLAGLLYATPKLAKEAKSDAEHREWARRNGYETYWSSTGKRYVKDNSKVYK